MSVELSSEREPARHFSARGALNEPAEISGLPPGTYHVSATSGAATATTDAAVAPAETVTLSVTTTAAGSLQLLPVDRLSPSGATTFDQRRLRELPSGSGLWGLLDSAVPFVITDRIDTGGLALGTAARVGSRGASWKRTNVRFGDTDLARGVTGPDQLVWLPDLRIVDAVLVSSGMATPDIATPGASITFVPRRPDPMRHGALDVSFSAPGMAATNSSPGAPSIARVSSWAGATAELSTPVASRGSLFLAGSASSLRAYERDLPSTNSSTAVDVFAHAIRNLDDRTQLRVVAAVQGVGRPSAQLPRRFSDPREHDGFVHSQATLEHYTAFGARVELSAAYQHGSFSTSTGALSQVAIDRATDGPIPLQAADASVSRSEARAVVAAPETHGHHVELGLSLARSSASFRSTAPVPIVESVAGLPARVWLGADPAVDSARRVFDAAGYFNDRLQAGRNLTLNIGIRLGVSTGSVTGATPGLAWRAALPRLGIRWANRIATVFGSYGRYQDELPFEVLAFGDPGEPVRDVYRWNDANANGRFEQAELGPRVARSGRGARLASFDPNLRAPHTDEVTFGAERRLGSQMQISVTGIVRRERALIQSVNVGAPASSYSIRSIPDRGEDWDSPSDDRLLAVYDRLPSSFGSDRFLLTNADGGTASYDGLEIAWRLDGPRWWSFARASAYRSEGSGGNRGFRAEENDQGVIGELLENPNAGSYARGRLFFDRAYVLKWATGYRAPHDVTMAVVARYQDGQPFSRLLAVPDLSQGPELVPAYVAGRTRFTFTTTIDARVEKKLQIGARRAAIRLDLYNLSNLGNEVEENALTGPDFRRTTAVQPPLTLRLGFRVEF